MGLPHDHAATTAGKGRLARGAGLVFALFDREAGRRRKVVAGGLGALLLMGATHVALTGPWVREAGQALGLPHPAQSTSGGR